ncbi:MAG TPA: hypothetical protein VH575_10800 [Gemmataceae bacterium]|jgi:hypothetical protein
MTRAFPADMLAVADALRHVQQQIAFLVYAEDDRIAGHAETQTILADGLDVADALERLAELLAETK